MSSRCSTNALANSIPPQLGGGVKNGADDLVVAGAPAEVAREPVARLDFPRIRLAVQQALAATSRPGVQKLDLTWWGKTATTKQNGENIAHH